MPYIDKMDVLRIWVFKPRDSSFSPNLFQIIDNDGVVVRIVRRDWIFGRETNTTHTTFSLAEIEPAIDRVIKNNGCFIRISGMDEKRDIPISRETSESFQLFYDAYKVLEKYFEDYDTFRFGQLPRR